MTRIVLVLAVSLAILSSGMAQEDSSDIDTWEVAATDPVSAVGHGAILDAQGKEVDRSPEFVVVAQRFYLKRLYQQANEQQRAEFKARYQRVQAVKRLTQQEQILVNAALIDWLIDAVKPQDAAYLGSKNTVLRNRFVRPTDSEPGISPTLLERLKLEGLIKPLSATTAGGEAYLTECSDAGVPLPPDWGSPNWQARGMLTTNFLKSSSTPDAEVFAFESDSPQGVCLALPRSLGDTIILLGIICLGIETSNACFWDNIEINPNTGTKKEFPIPKGSSVPIAKFFGGADLLNGNGVCTDCHAGENPFIVHPGTPLDMGTKLTAKAWYDPLVHQDWPQNPGPTNVLNGIALNPGEGSCLTCHASGRRFPDVSTDLPGYCDTVLELAFKATMPVGDVGNPKYNKHISALQTACKQPPQKPCQVVVNGATQSSPVSGNTTGGGVLCPCTDPTNCPLGFCYWRTLHGPFWQLTDASIPITAPEYRGSWLRIYAEGGQWKQGSRMDVTGLPPNAPPGGTVECTNYKDIANLPDPINCFNNLAIIFDPKGTDFSSSVEATGPGVSANVLSGYIGNVAQTNAEEPDFLRVFEQSGKVLLAQQHNSTPPPPFQLGPLTGEAWIDGCTGWTPNFAAKDVLSTSDVQLVPYPQSKDVRCFITGITGAWSSTRNNATEQPFAEIYEGSGKDVRLRVSPTGDAQDRVGAMASCIFIK